MSNEHLHRRREATPSPSGSFEHTVVVNPDWDLISVAVDRADFARLTAAEYEAFVAAYGGHDVTCTPWFRAMADIQELRWTTFVADKASYDPGAALEARHRIASLRGPQSHGPGPRSRTQGRSVLGR